MKIVFAHQLATHNHVGKVYLAMPAYLGWEENLDMFTPTWDMEHGRRGDAGYLAYSEKEYIAAYLRLLQSRSREVRAWLDNLNQDVTICCDCLEGRFCHRRILAHWVQAYYLDQQRKVQVVLR